VRIITLAATPLGIACISRRAQLTYESNHAEMLVVLGLRRSLARVVCPIGPHASCTTANPHGSMLHRT
jgi:hypothetical protein